MNNLLERLHASIFFYILTDASYFNKIGSYLPSAILVSVGMIFHGLDTWVAAGWRLEDPISSEKAKEELKWVTRKRPVLPAIAIMGATHLFGATLFGVLSSSWALSNYTVCCVQSSIFIMLTVGLQTASSICFLLIVLFPLVALLVPPSAHPASPSSASVSIVLKALNLCIASTIISVTTVLNFSLALSLSVVLGIPLVLSGFAPLSSTDRQHRLPGLIRYPLYATLAAGWLVLLPEQTKSALWNWEVLGVWFAPVICVVYVPLVLQAAMVGLLSV